MADISAKPRATPTALSALRAWWTKLAPRERRVVAFGLGLLALALVWMLALRPALAVVRDTPARIAVLDEQLQQMQRMALEGKELRGAPRLPPAQAQAALKVATDALGATGRLTLAGDRATLSLTNASGDQLRRWLVDARTNARARAVEAKLTRGAAGYNGSVVVALPTGTP